ncbi:MAG TPA: hypothetical protein VLD61_01305 [Methylomirabilota bacterium]|nr:hypothetical protein [Methylomirabilota bacterium]
MGSRVSWPWRAALAVVVLELMYGPFLAEHIRNAADPWVFHEDVRQFVTPFLVRDHAGTYYRTFLPVGYRTLYAMGGRLMDAATLSKALPYALLVLVLLGVSAAAGRIGGVAAGFGAAALTLSTGLVLDFIVGGTPRAFGFPLVAGIAVTLAFGRPGWLAAVSVIAAAFYPVVAVIGGLALAGLLLREATALRDGPWPHLARRLALLAATALGILLAAAPSLVPAGYGSRIGPRDVAAYPEAGPAGRYIPEDRFPEGSAVRVLAGRAGRVTQASLAATAGAWSPSLRAWAAPHARGIQYALLGVLVIGLLQAARTDAAARRLWLLPGAALAGLVAACLGAPYLYLPDRYITYSLPILVVIGLPVAAGALPGLVAAPWCRAWMRPVATLAVVGATLLLVGGRGDGAQGFTDVNDAPRLFQFLAGLPPDVLIAGWPGDQIDSVPYLARRPAFLTRETHQAFHRGYADEMRQRLHALTAAVFATDAAPLGRLRDQWGVTHLLVDLRYYGPHPPTYFEPFRAEVAAAVARGHTGGFEVLRRVPQLTVFRDGPLVVLALGRLVP